MGSLTAPEKSNWILGEAFDKRMPHHESIKALWETKWKFPCTISVYPFHDGKFQDFEEVFNYMIENKIEDGYGEAYTKAFFPVAERLTTEADKIASTNQDLSSELYLRAACLYRIARFPYIFHSSHLSPPKSAKWEAWERQKAVYLKAATAWPEPVQEILVPHVHGVEGEKGKNIPVYVRKPESAVNGIPVPTVILMTGLDGYRPDNTQRTWEFISRGWATVVVEIPGTADCPADEADPKAPERLWDSLLGWMKEEGGFDMKNLLVWGLSCGGYYAVRIAHTHKEQIKGSIGQGAGTHWFFEKNWQIKAEGHEYPFALGPAISQKYGYESVEAFRDGSKEKFSLLDTGILDKPSSRLLLINGVNDGLMPIEDSMLCFEHGTPKEARFIPNALHMGYPTANAYVYPWMESVLSS